MKDEWKKILVHGQQLYFGDLYDINMLKTYYFEDKKLEENRNTILAYINDEFDYSPILIGGDAGVGKSTFIQNLVSKHLPNDKFFNIILNVDNQPNNPFIKEYLVKQLSSYCSFLTSGEIIGNKIISKYKIEYQKYIADEMYYSSKEERINAIIQIISAIFKYLKSKEQIFPRIIIFLDQVEKFGSDTLINYITEYLGFVSSSRCIKFIMCARKETISVAKQSLKGFFSTYFKRYITIDSPPIEKVLQKRFYIGQNKYPTIETINNYFTKAFCDLIEDISNNNLRIMLRIFEKIIETTIPYQGRDGYVHYVSFLIQNDYITDLYKVINKADNIPLIKIVFDALHFYGTVDDKFYSVIVAKTMTVKSIKNIIGLTKENINIAVRFLFDNDFITDNFDINNRYSFTKKGDAYSKIIETDAYTKIFIKDIDNDKFRRNIFTDQDFSRNIPQNVQLKKNSNSSRKRN